MSTSDSDKLYILYQMGSSEEYTWYSVVAVFRSEEKLREYAEKKEIEIGPQVRHPDDEGNVVLSEPTEYVVAASGEGEVPEVELSDEFSGPGPGPGPGS